MAAELEVGDTVRVSRITRANVRKEAMLGARKGYERQWSTELYTIASKSAGSNRSRIRSQTMRLAGFSKSREH